MIDNNLLEVICCPDCRGDIVNIASRPERLQCSVCSRYFNIDEGILIMLPSAPAPLPPMYQNLHYLKFQEIKNETIDEYFQNANFAFRAIHNSSHAMIASWCRNSSLFADDWAVDMGCGTGSHFEFIKTAKKRIIGFDSDKKSLLRAKKKAPEAHFVQGNIYKMPFKNSAINNIVAIYVLEHVYDLSGAFDEVNRIMKKDGHFFVGLPAEGGIFWNTGRCLTSQKALSKKYNLDYSQVIKVEHCNTAKHVIGLLKKVFSLKNQYFFPFNFLPVAFWNMTISLELVKREASK